MRATIFLGALLGWCAATRQASAEDTQQKAKAAEAALQKAHDETTSAEAQLKEAIGALQRKQEESPVCNAIKDWEPIPAEGNNDALKPWCDEDCINKYNALLKSKTLSGIDKNAASELKKKVDQAPAPPDVLALTLAFPKDTAVAEKKEKDELALEKAVLIAACYRATGPVALAECRQKIDSIAAYQGDPASWKRSEFDGATALEIKNRPLSRCGQKCLEKYNLLRSKATSKLDTTALPSIEATKALQVAIASGGAAAKVDDYLARVVISDTAPDAQRALLLAVCSSVPEGNFSAECMARLATVGSCQETATAFQEAVNNAQAKVSSTTQAEVQARSVNEEAQREAQIAADQPARRLSDRLALVRKARCATAYCWGGDDGRKYAIEPILDLPVGMYWSLGDGALTHYINANNVKIQVNAGLRYWFAYDVMSVGILLAQPNLTDSPTSIDFRGHQLATSQVHRSYPTFVVGLWADILQASFSVDELRNGAASTPNYVPEFQPNSVLSRAITIGIAINPITAARNGIGATSESKEESK
jgi:hypothetical protein